MSKSDPTNQKILLTTGSQLNIQTKIMREQVNCVQYTGFWF